MSLEDESNISKFIDDKEEEAVLTTSEDDHEFTDSELKTNHMMHRIPTFPLEYLAQSTPPVSILDPLDPSNLTADDDGVHTSCLFSATMVAHTPTKPQPQSHQPPVLIDNNNEVEIANLNTAENDKSNKTESTEQENSIQTEEVAIEVLTNKPNQVLSVSSYYSTFTIWDPRTWFSSRYSHAIEDIESRMMKCLKTKVNRYNVYIRNSSLHIWTVSANTESKNTPIVMVHGFCGGVAMWIHNIDALSESRPFYAFDLLGFGRSARPPFSTDPIVAETQFIESIEDWRKAVDIKEFILLGHSFGGYLSTSYAIKYPQCVKALILADPWGFPDIPNPSHKPDTQMPLWISAIAKASRYVSPLSLFRLTGQVGVYLFKQLRPDFKRKYITLLDEPELVYDYIYYANCLNPTGEAGFRAIAEYFGFAKNPMIHRIDRVSNDIPIWFVYGSRSWVDYSSGYVSITLRQNSVLTSVKLITNAGHHVYADKPTDFNEYVQYIFHLIDEHEKSIQNGGQSMLSTTSTTGSSNS